MLCEICKKEQAFDKHHIKSKCFGGSDNKFNIAFLCCNCHKKVHLGEIILEGKFSSTSGPTLIYHRKNEPSITGLAPEVYVYQQPRVSSRT